MTIVTSKQQYKIIYDLQKTFLYECKEKMIKVNYHDCPEWNDFHYTYIRHNRGYEVSEMESGHVLIFFHVDEKFDHYMRSYKTKEDDSFLVAVYHTDNADDSCDKFYILSNSEFENFKNTYFK